MKSEFLSDLCLTELEEEGRWRLNEPLLYASALLNLQLIVPPGFETDFASVPRVPIVYTQFGDRAHRESVIHDWLYYTGVYPRKKADAVFLEAMEARNKPLWIRRAMWIGVRLGGWKAWNEHRKAGHPQK